ncbi:transcription termination/antitermination NusG family protein [Bradyrhizobium barranii subsp. barranii]|uniref:Transcription termination/antitermination NusG family protein n=1 Tax=Bradyrhizobium barranii subsp. barranii TaxID=2823807 RepID=A0A939M983_9BRAD|nr:transcription termination/antitermination NusG family protein [Bradyrhizobium barranii]UEM09031.1 transcription termination/antitermination NusG family protein [Bradyrhizobium barranii subsp. barranii]
MTTKLPAAFSPEVIAELARPYVRFDPRTAQLSPDVEPRWYAVEISSRDVEAELIKRRFGIYVPECDETIVSRGRKIERRVPMFVGYVFVFLWATDQNWQQIVATPGVVGILGELTDDEIDRVRRRENTERPIALQSFPVQRVAPAGKKKQRYRRRKKPITIMVEDEIVCVRPWSAFEDAIETLDSEGRTQALRDYILS